MTKSLAATVADALRPFCRDGQEVIWRLALRWHGDNGPLPNRYNGMSIRSLSQFGLEVIADCGQAAIIAALPGAEK
ncbi:MAG TPA: hypothetical protein DIT28_09990 [Oxalobacteraceae bacterium]|nr:hypothetical protein [Oxalobacteraceae bacterium]